MLNNLPHNPEAAHALIKQKLNEHTEALREVKEENVKQNQELGKISDKLDKVDRHTSGIVEVVLFTRHLCRVTKLAGKFIIWFSGVAGALYGLWQLAQVMS